MNKELSQDAMLSLSVFQKAGYFQWASKQGFSPEKVFDLMTQEHDKKGPVSSRCIDALRLERNDVLQYIAAAMGYNG